jgi:three-Cys-motif partner protein
MTDRPYQWAEGAVLQEHSKKKHQILRNYISEYLSIRCSVPQQTRFRFALVDGFCGGGAYEGGHPGSPLIFLETLIEQTSQINIRRAADGMAQIAFECFCIFNDFDKVAIEILKKNLAPVQEKAKSLDHLNIKIAFLNKEFASAYSDIKKLLAAEQIPRNVFFNLDQCGSSHVSRSVIIDILRTYQSAEVLLTFAAQSMLTYLSRNNPVALQQTLERYGVDPKQAEDISPVASKREWRAAIEGMVFEAYRRCSTYVSPFAIHNPDGWYYWLMHFANEPKARQVYNDLLHENAGAQGHYGRAGLRMLSYNPKHEGSEYLFAEEDRSRAVDELMDDIPKAIAEFGDAVSMADFYRNISNETPAHTADIARVMIENPDISVITPNGRARRSAKGIKNTDTIILNPQRSLFILPPIKKS